MIVTGYKLQNAIRDWETQRKIASGLFDNSLHVFEDEEETASSPHELMDQYKQAEDAIAKIQMAQLRYNLHVEVNVQGTKMTLAEAVKRVGGAGRMEAMWRAAATDGTKRDRWSRDRSLTRSTDEERARPTLKRSEAIELTRTSGRYASSLREAIKTGNAREIEIEGLESSLFL